MMNAYENEIARWFNEPTFDTPSSPIVEAQIQIPPPTTIYFTTPVYVYQQYPYPTAQYQTTQYQTPQFSTPPYQASQYIPQYPTISTPPMTAEIYEPAEDKKRKQSSRPFERRVRTTRPKVVESKGAVQCKGTNRKKGIQCRNAALMEYIGPRPQYCAEHIQLDPESLYEKCRSSYQKEPGDAKGCKEVVLKEFGICFKHYADLVQEMVQNNEGCKLRNHMERISALLMQLETDAAAAKKKDGDLYQRKNKLIPKFSEMKKIALKAMESLDLTPPLEVKLEVSSPCYQTDCEDPFEGPPVVLALDSLPTSIVEGLSSGEEDDILSSPSSFSEEDFCN